MTKVKICGITSYEDAKMAIDSGADALGFNFVAASSRCISPIDAQLIIRRLPPSVWFVGVFADQEKDAVKKIARLASLDTLQFHGEETPEYCGGFAAWRVMKALRPRRAEDIAAATAFEAVTEFYLFDAYSEKQRGGTGNEIATAILQSAVSTSLLARSFLAGGLTPENVGEKVRLYRPYGVDVASGVESSPGKKDAAKVHAFIQAVRSAAY